MIDGVKLGEIYQSICFNDILVKVLKVNDTDVIVRMIKPSSKPKLDDMIFYNRKTFFKRFAKIKACDLN